MPRTRRARLLALTGAVIALATVVVGLAVLNDDDREADSPTTERPASSTTTTTEPEQDPGELVPTLDIEVRSWDERDLSEQPELATATEGYLSSTAHVAFPPIDDPTSVTRAALAFQVTDGGSVAVTSSEEIDEAELDWAGRPASLNMVESAARAAAGQPLQLDVTTEVHAGHHTFALRAAGADRVAVAASEHPSLPGPTLRLARGTVHEMPPELVSEIARPECDPSMPDSTGPVQAWIDSVPDGSVARFPAGQCVRAERTLFVHGRRGLTIDGNGSTLVAFTDGCESQTDDGNPTDACSLPPPVDAPEAEADLRWPQSRSAFWVSESTDIVFEDITVDGGYESVGELINLLEFQHGWRIDGGNDGIVLDQVRADRFGGDYVYLRDSDNSTVQNGVFGEGHGEASGNGRQGIAVTDGTNVYIRRNTVAAVTRSIIDIEADRPEEELRNIVIEHNTFDGEGALAWLSNVGADALHDGVYIRFNTINRISFAMQVRSRAAPDPSNLRRRNYQIVGNVGTQPSANPAGWLILVNGVEGLLVQGNEAIAREPSDLTLVDARSSRNVRVIGNTLLNGADAGRYAATEGVCERGNMVGDPVRPEQAPTTSGC